MMAVGLVSLTLMPQKSNRSHTPWQELTMSCSSVLAARMHLLRSSLRVLLFVFPLLLLSLSIVSRSLSSGHKLRGRRRWKLCGTPYPEVG